MMLVVIAIHLYEGYVMAKFTLTAILTNVLNLHLKIWGKKALHICLFFSQLNLCWMFLEIIFTQKCKNKVKETQS